MTPLLEVFRPLWRESLRAPDYYYLPYLQSRKPGWMTHTPVKHRDARKANVHSRSNPESEKTKLRMHMWSSSTSQFSGSP